MKDLPEAEWTRVDIGDSVMRGWHVELTHQQNWGAVQFASVNTRTHLTIESDDGNGQVPFTGWRITLDEAGLDELISAATLLRQRLLRTKTEVKTG